MSALMLFVGCLHTKPHEPLAQAVEVRFTEREEVADAEGRTCRWEEESLWLGTTRVLGADPPDDQQWCREPSDHWTTLEVLGQDGRFVSVLEAAKGGSPRCRTWDVVARREATLAEYDEKAEPRRLKRGARLAAEAGLALDPAAFIVRDGHVRFCVFRPSGERVELLAR